MKRHLIVSTVFLGAWLLLCIFAGSAEAKFRALLVGIDYKSADTNISRLHGAINDIRETCSLMTGELGIPECSIRMLLEESATREGIIGAFREWLIDGTEPGDVVYFQYSGHGTQIPDTSGSQKEDPLKAGKPKDQELAEALVPFDTAIDTESRTLRNLIPDAEFHALLDQLKGRDVTLFLDNCHSAGVTRDFAKTGIVTRNLQLPWQPWETRVDTPSTAFTTVTGGGTEATSRSILRRKDKSEWHPDYCLFAAAKYFQSAYEYPLHQGKNGAFTLPVLQLIRANPSARYTNKQLVDYARHFIHEVGGISETLQEAAFYGPKEAAEKTFVLLAQAHSGGSPPDSAAKPPGSGLQPTSPGIDKRKTGILLAGTDGPLKSRLASDIEASGFARIELDRPDAIVEVRPDAVHIHSAAGKRLKTVPLPAPDTGTGAVMGALESLHVVRELAALENPAAPFAVELWIDEPGKTTFRTSDRVTVYCRVNSLPKGQKAYLTLLNVAPDGTVSILYPQKKDFSVGSGGGPGTSQAKLYLNAEIDPGKVHSIPKNWDALKPGQNVAVDLRIRLSEGQEYFKTIITSELIDWASLNLGEFRASFQGGTGRILAVEAVERVKETVFWSTASLRVEVAR